MKNPRHRKHKRSWTPKDINILRKWYPRRGSHFTAQLLHRSVYAVQHRAKDTGIKFAGVREWTQKENAVLRKNYHIKGLTATAAMLGRTIASACWRARQLGISKRAMRWTTEEIQFLHDNSAMMPTKELSAALNRTGRAIDTMRRNLGLSEKRK
ncbi:MAG: hypothetical protein ABR936_02725 [Bacteroidota bacterium]|jgi:hypothetical protein